MVSIRICQDGHANSLALSPDQNSIAVAGRSLLKVFSIQNDGFVELNNMRGAAAGSQKNHNLSYSSNCVAWNPIDAHILATSSTNGSVSLWDLKKFGRQKQLLVFNEHERTTHTVTFHQTDANLLISGSQDGMIKLFDLRQEKSVSTFCSTESVRDCKFNPQSSNFFAAVSENGTVQMWDVRKPDRCNFQFTAHSGPIYTCDFHPTQNWLATGSRDKQIKIWNISTNKPPTTPPIYTIHTIAVVGRVKWRPERKFHIASAATVVDYSIYIWDVRRPFIPYASFSSSHTNIVTDIAFRGNDPHTLLSTSKDSTIYKHSSKNAEHPASKTNPQGATINYKGDMVFVCKTKNVIPVALTSSSSKLNFLNKKTSVDVVDSPREEFHLAKSNIHSFSMQEKALSPMTNKSSNDSTLKTTLAKDYNFLQGCALDYKLTGAGFFELCDINAAVAKKYGRMNVYHLWCYVKNIYLSTKFTIENQPIFNRLSAQNSNQSSSGLSILTRASGSFGTTGLSTIIVNGASTASNLEEKPEVPNGLNGGSSSSDLAEIVETSNEMVCNSSINDCDFVFDEKELTIENIDCVKNFRNGFLYTGPHDLLKELSFPSCSSSFDLQQTNHHFKNHNSRRNDIVMHREQETSPPPSDMVPSILCVPETLPPSPWTPYQVIADCLTLQCEIGDVQTATCILIVLGDKREDLPLDKSVHEMWLQAYVELLHKFQMWNQATEIMNLAWIPKISEMNNNSTIIHTTCGECGRVLQGPGWYCKYCKSMEPARCVVCNLVVRGVFAFCSICNHGGHLEHLKEWYYLNLNCPKCGCTCEYD